MLNHAFYFFKMGDVIAETVSSCTDHGFGVPMIFCRDIFWTLASRGFFGVNFFFVISGFLITGLLMDFIQNRLDIGRFYLRRCFKIIPHYYFLILIVFIPLFCSISFSSWPQVWQGLVPYLFFFQNYCLGASWLDHTWSLVTEEQFYIFWSVFLFFISRYLGHGTGRWRAAVWGAGVLVILITINRFFLYTHGTSLVFVYPMQTAVMHGTSVVADGLMAGCILRLLWFRYPAYFRDAKRARIFYLLGIIVACVLLVLPLSTWGVSGAWYGTTLAWVFPACFIMAGLGGVVWVCQASWLRSVGKSSYGIYLVHYPFLIWMSDRLAGGYLSFMIYMILAVFLGVFTTFTVEKYFLNMRKKLAP